MYFTVITKKKLIGISAIIVAIILLIVVLTCSFGSKGVFGNKATRELPIYRVQTEQKKLAISFDCAWGVDYTDSLLKTMQEENVKCTFFTVEFWAEKHPEYVKKISDAGHEIGTHSATHPYMSKLDKKSIIRELTTSVNAIENITGKKVKTFRPPYGDYNDNLIQTARELGLYTIQWDVDSLDWKGVSSEQITKNIITKTKSGSIILCHNNADNILGALDGVINNLKSRGYEFVTLSELVYEDNFYIDNTGKQIKNI